MFKILALIVLPGFLLGCQPEPKGDYSQVKERVNNAFVKEDQLQKESFLRILPTQTRDPKINFNSRQMKIIDVLRYSLPKDIKVKKLDRYVDLQDKISIKADNLDLKDYLRKLFNATDYEYTFIPEDRELRIFLLQQKTWDLSAFTSSSNTSGSMGGDGLSSTSSKSIDKWQAIIKAANTILELQTVALLEVNDTGSNAGSSSTGDSGTAKMETTTDSEENQIKEWIIEDRPMGTITAYATAKKIQNLDRYITTQKTLASTQIQLEVKAFEVALSDDASSGINWDLFDTSEPNTLGENYVTGQMKSNNGVATALSALAEGQLGLQITGQLKRVGVSAIVSFLEKHGEVHLVTEPTITILNGGSAFLSSGDKISYNSGFETLSVEGSAPVIYPKSEQVDIGTNIVLTPNVSTDGEIIIDVLATLTSLKKMHTTTLPIGTINNPELAVQEISTQVIAKNNKPVRLGGLIVQRLTTSKTTAPTTNEWMSAPFDSGYNNIEKRELVMVITPKIIHKSQ